MDKYFKLEWAKIFLDKDSKSIQNESKLHKWNYNKLQSSAQHRKQLSGETTYRMGENVCQYITDKG
jgi:hypothetical protein